VNSALGFDFGHAPGGLESTRAYPWRDSARFADNYPSLEHNNIQTQNPASPSSGREIVRPPLPRFAERFS
jgi:hypothetical protein